MNLTFEHKLIKYRNLQQILKSTVKIARKILNCDRVLIYSLSIANDGVVIAESVADGWTKILAQATKNSQVATQYLEEDRNGKVRVWDNTYDEDAPSWYRKQLAALNVKAGLIASRGDNTLKYNAGQAFCVCDR